MGAQISNIDARDGLMVSNVVYDYMTTHEKLFLDQIKLKKLSAMVSAKRDALRTRVTFLKQRLRLPSHLRSLMSHLCSLMSQRSQRSQTSQLSRNPSASVSISPLKNASRSSGGLLRAFQRPGLLLTTGRVLAPSAEPSPDNFFRQERLQRPMVPDVRWSS